MDFKNITLPDAGALRPYLRGQYRSCDYSVLGVFMWADRFGYEYNISDGVLFMRERSRSGGGCFSTTRKTLAAWSAASAR